MNNADKLKVISLSALASLDGQSMKALRELAFTEMGRTSETYRPERKSHRATVATNEKRVQRNAPCPCGSGKKFKRCCG